MKTIFSNRDLVHLFATVQGTKDINKTYAQNSGRTMYIQGNTIFSYGSHFPMAQHDKKGATLVTLRRYSNTTAKQMSHLFGAIHHLEIIKCWYISPTGEAGKGTHKNNFEEWHNEAFEIGKKLSRARKPELYINQLEEIKKQVELYAQYFKLKVPSKLEKSLNVATKGDFYKLNKSKLDAAARRKRKAEKEAAARIEREKKEHEERVQKFLNFENNGVYGRYDRDYIRFNKEKQVFQTSQGIEINKKEGTRFYKLLKSKAVKVGDKISDSHSTYNVSRINKTIDISCHTFPVSELIELGDKYLIE